MMKRSLIGFIVVAVFMLLGATGPTLKAAPLNQATQVAAQNWGVGALLRVKASVPFSWLRVSPSADAHILATAPSGDFLVVAGATPQWDGVQWWWRVRWGGVIGYVEQQSLDLVLAAPTSSGPPSAATTIPPTATQPPPTGTPRPHQTTQATWSAGSQLRVIQAVPFAWLRTGPSSAGQPFDTLSPGTLLIVVSASPQWDGVQWWWQVRRTNGSIYGYVEQDSLEFVSAGGAQTLAPTVTAGTIPTTATAASPGGATAVAAANWALGTLHSVRVGLPFAWVRAQPSSDAGIAATLYPGWLVLIHNATPTWDGRQWWWEVTVPARGIVGWIEQTALL
jgi:hypothetical protein